MGMRRGRRARRDCIGIHTHENVGARLVAEAERSRRDPDAFPAHAGPWLDVRFERPAAAARFARNVRNVLGYRATVDPANPRLVVTNAARWEISDLLVRTNTGRASSPLSREEHAPRARDPKQQRLFGDAGHGQLDLYSTVDPDVTIAYLDRGVRTIVRLRRSEARAFLRTLPKGAWTTETRRIAREVAVRAGRDHARRRVRRRDPGRKTWNTGGSASILTKVRQHVRLPTPASVAVR